MPAPPVPQELVAVATLTPGPNSVVVKAAPNSVQERYGVDPDQYLDHGSRL